MIPRIAMFNNIAGFGRCSTMVSLPVLSAMQVQVCPVPTAILSNHLGFPVCYKTDLTDHLRGYLKTWQQLGATFDGTYCGFLGNSEQLQIVKEFLENFDHGISLLDPTMGDHGKYYSSIGSDYCQGLKALLPYANLITPNLTEACLLTDTPWKQDEDWSDSDLQTLCEKLSHLCPGKIVITGVKRGNQLLNYIRENTVHSTYSIPDAGGAHHGTGDLFSAILMADALHNVDLYTSVKKASDFVTKCITETNKASAPEPEGLLFEKYLRDLM